MNNRECVAIATALAQAFAENLAKYRGKSADPMQVLSTAEEHISHALQVINRKFNTKAFHDVIFSTAFRMLNKEDRVYLGDMFTVDELTDTYHNWTLDVHDALPRNHTPPFKTRKCYLHLLRWLEQNYVNKRLHQLPIKEIADLYIREGGYR